MYLFCGIVCLAWKVRVNIIVWWLLFWGVLEKWSHGSI